MSNARDRVAAPDKIGVVLRAGLSFALRVEELLCWSFGFRIGVLLCSAPFAVCQLNEIGSWK